MEIVAPIPPSPGPFAPRRLFRLARKEVTEIVRDRRTIVTLLAMPLLLYPLLTIGFGQFVVGSRTPEAPVEYRIGFASKADEQTMQAHLERGRRGRSRGPGEREPKIWVGTLTADFADLEAAVRAGAYDLGLQPAGPNAWTAIFRDDSLAARDALQYVQEFNMAGDLEELRANFRQAGQQPPPRTRLVAAALAMDNPSRFSLAVFVPLVLILMTMTGAVYPAIDLTAGERERGTLELLIAAPVPRVSLLLAKYTAVVSVAVLTALVNLGSMTASILIGGLADRVFGAGGLHLATLLEVFGIILLFAAFFAAVLLVVTSFARSFKEAQAYLIPLMVVSLMPGIAGLLPGLQLSGPLAVVPLLNIVLLARDLLSGHANGLSAVVVVVSTAAYALLAVATAARVFGAEGVLYGDAGGWRTLLRSQG